VASCLTRVAYHVPEFIFAPRLKEYRSGILAGVSCSWTGSPGEFPKVSSRAGGGKIVRRVILYERAGAAQESLFCTLAPTRFVTNTKLFGQFAISHCQR